MIEKMKAVSNPLTIIAIFAGLAEIASVVAIKLVNPELQYIFIWFVMLFPSFLVLLFFLTLNFNPKVLYAPSDFKDDQAFLQTLNVSQVSMNLETVQKELEETKTKILNEVESQVKITGETERNKLTEIVNNQIGSIQSRVEKAQSEVEVIINSTNKNKNSYQETIFSKFIFDEIKSSPHGLTQMEISEQTDLALSLVIQTVDLLYANGSIVRYKDSHGHFRYKV